jgi:hypothetical protein
MNAPHSINVLVPLPTTQHHVPEEHNYNIHCHENLECDYVLVQLYCISLCCSCEMFNIIDLTYLLPRAMKSVLAMAGSLKYNNPRLSEDIVIKQALHDSNLPKFLAQDSNLFQVRMVYLLFPTL